MSKKQKAFTLAEVLITLAVIGIVAALTIPSMLNNTDKKTLEVKRKKAESILVNGYKLMMVKEGVFQFDNMSFLSDITDTDAVSNAHKKVFNIVDDSTKSTFVSSLPQSYLVDDASQESQFKWANMDYVFRTTDGVTYGITYDATTHDYSVVVDVNNAKGPNVAAKDLFKYRYIDKGILADVSSELSTIAVCTVENYSGCTQAQCESLSADWPIHFYWSASRNRCEYCNATNHSGNSHY